MAVTYLDRILATHRAAADADSRSLGDLRTRAEQKGAIRDFAAALRSGGVALIAEVKRASPSKGVLAADLDPASLAREYRDGGASCLSVLTDRQFFSGSPDDLEAARNAVGLPVLRKDFTISEADVYDARLMGADAVLLIVAALTDPELSRFHEAATAMGMCAVVEVHDEDEAARAVDVGARVIGVNQRDLITFEVDTDRAIRVASSIPADVISVAESGIAEPADVARLGQAGFDAVLVGESLVLAADRPARVRSLIDAGRPPK